MVKSRLLFPVRGNQPVFVPSSEGTNMADCGIPVLTAKNKEHLEMEAKENIARELI